MWKMGKASIVVHVKVREDDLAYISCANAKGAKLGANLVYRLDLELDAELKIRMPNGKRFQMRRLARIDNDNSFGVLDGPAISR